MSIVWKIIYEQPLHSENRFCTIHELRYAIGGFKDAQRTT